MQTCMHAYMTTCKNTYIDMLHVLRFSLLHNYIDKQHMIRRDGLSSWRVILFVPAGMLSGKWVRTMIQQPGMTMNSKLTSSHSMHCRDPLCKNCTCNNKPSRSIELRLGANWLRLKTGMTAIGKAKAKAKAKTHAKGLKLTLEATTPTPSTTT